MQSPTSLGLAIGLPLVLLFLKFETVLFFFLRTELRLRQTWEGNKHFSNEFEESAKFQRIEILIERKYHGKRFHKLQQIRNS